MVVGLVLFARLGLSAHYTSLLPGFMLFGAGAGLMNVPLTNAVMATTPSSVAGVASALLNASREVAGLLGITVIGAVLRTAQGASARGGVEARLRGPLRSSRSMSSGQRETPAHG